jgi:alcohol dehydrogenase class IV
LLGEDTSGLDEDAAAELAITRVERIKHEIGIPERIRDIGGAPIQLPLFAEKSYAIARLRWVNPRASTQKDILNILTSAF